MGLKRELGFANLASGIMCPYQTNKNFPQYLHLPTKEKRSKKENYV